MKDGYELQQDLIGHIRETEEVRNGLCAGPNQKRAYRAGECTVIQVRV